MVSRLGAPDLDCGHGLRTMSSNAAGFNPISYHGGSVWPHDTAIALNGLANTPARAAGGVADSLIRGLLTAVARIRLPAARTVRRRRGSTRCAPGAVPGVLPASGVVGRVRDRGALDRARRCSRMFRTVCCDWPRCGRHRSVISPCTGFGWPASRSTCALPRTASWRCCPRPPSCTSRSPTPSDRRVPRRARLPPDAVRRRIVPRSRGRGSPSGR